LHGLQQAREPLYQVGFLLKNFKFIENDFSF
jgi:hypothetical protein